MTNHIFRRSAIVAVAMAGVIGLGACSAGIEDETDAMTTESDDAAGDTSPTEDTNPSPSEPVEDSGDALDSPPEESADPPAEDPTDAQEEPDGTGDTDSTDDSAGPDPAGIVEGLTIKARPQGGRITAEGAYDCGGQPVTVEGQVEVTVVTGSCPELTVSGSGSNVLVASDVPTELVVNANSTQVLLNIAAGVSVQGNSNELGFARADSVELSGSGNNLAFDNAESVTIDHAAQENQLAFLETAGITVNGGRNALGYGSGPPPVDNGPDNQFFSGEQVASAVEDVLAELETTFVELTESLPS